MSCVQARHDPVLPGSSCFRQVLAWIQNRFSRGSSCAWARRSRSHPVTPAQDWYWPRIGKVNAAWATSRSTRWKVPNGLGHVSGYKNSATFEIFVSLQYFLLLFTSWRYPSLICEYFFQVYLHFGHISDNITWNYKELQAMVTLFPSIYIWLTILCILNFYISWIHKHLLAILY